MASYSVNFEFNGEKWVAEVHGPPDCRVSDFSKVDVLNKLRYAIRESNNDPDELVGFSEIWVVQEIEEYNNVYWGNRKRIRVLEKRGREHDPQGPVR